VEPGQTVVVAMHSVGTGGGCEGDLQYEALEDDELVSASSPARPEAEAEAEQSGADRSAGSCSKSRGQVPRSATVWLRWCNPGPGLASSYGRYCETKVQGTLPLKVRPLFRPASERASQAVGAPGSICVHVTGCWCLPPVCALN
jgi:hypothetical protein